MRPRPARHRHRRRRDPPPGEPRTAASRRLRRLARRPARDDLGAAPGRSRPPPPPPEPHRRGRRRGGADAAGRARAALPRGRRFRRRRRCARRRKRSPPLSSRHGLVYRSSRSSSGAWAVFVLGLAVGSFLNVLIARLPFEKSIVWPSSRCFACFRPIRAARQHPDPRLPPAPRQVPALRRAVLQPLPVGRTRHRPGVRSALFAAEVLLEHRTSIPALNFNILAGNNALPPWQGLVAVPLPRRPALGPHRRRGHRRRAPHHPAADPVHRDGRSASSAARSCPGRGRTRRPRRTRSPPATRGSLPEHWGKIPLGRAAVAVLGADVRVRPARQLSTRAAQRRDRGAGRVARGAGHPRGSSSSGSAARRSAWATPTC